MGNMNRKLILKFIETQALILSPICPHVAECVWNLLGKPESILKARWPTVPEFDKVFISAGAYLEQAARDFRLRMKTYLTALTSKGAKKAANAPVAKPTHGTVWIAKSYPLWQSIILSLLQERYNVRKRNFCRLINFQEITLVFSVQADGVMPDNKTLSTELDAKPELKKYKKKVMPFVQMAKEKVAQRGIEAIKLTMDFSEFDVITKNIEYLTNTLDVSKVFNSRLESHLVIYYFWSSWRD